jgi:hypothetical protein
VPGTTVNFPQRRYRIQENTIDRFHYRMKNLKQQNAEVDASMAMPVYEQEPRVYDTRKPEGQNLSRRSPT